MCDDIQDIDPAQQALMRPIEEEVLNKTWKIPSRELLSEVLLMSIATASNLDLQLCPSNTFSTVRCKGWT